MRAADSVRWSLIFVAASTTLGCPLGRPKEVDCRGVRTILEQTDAKLAPFSAIDPDKATPAELKGWVEAIRDTRDALERDSSADGAVKDFRDDYRKELAYLREVVEARSKGGSGPGADVGRARANAATKRQAFDRVCPKP